MLRTKHTKGALYAKNNISEEELRPYKEKLDEALKDSRITNIAVSGPYGVGKSSILESYFEARKDNLSHIFFYISNKIISVVNCVLRKIGFSKYLQYKRDYEFINIPDFFEPENDGMGIDSNNGCQEGNGGEVKKKDVKVDSKELQKRILEQLLYKANPRKYPFSKINRIRDSSILKDSLYAVLFFLLLFMSYIHLYGIGVFSDVIEMTPDVINNSWFLVIGWFLVGITIFRKMNILVHKSKITGEAKTSLFDLKAEEEKIPPFNLFAEEIIYYFRKTSRRIVIFEDIDRFNNPNIFQALRELNTNLNKRTSKVVFIYVLRDEVFDIEDVELENTDIDDSNLRSKSKFFDYVLPIFPSVSLYNSRVRIKNEIEINKQERSETIKAIWNKIDDSFINQLGYYLRDTRVIITIFSELDLYIQQNKDKLVDGNDNEILNVLALIIYKNRYPTDYEQLSKRQSVLNYLFDDITQYKSLLYSLQVDELTKEIADLENTLEKTGKHLNTQFETLVNLYFEPIIKAAKRNYSSAELVVGKKRFKSNEGFQFFQYILKLKRDTVIKSSYTSKKICTVQEAFTNLGKLESFAYIMSEYGENDKESRFHDLLNDLVRKIEKKKKQKSVIREKIMTQEFHIILRELVGRVDTLDNYLEEYSNSEYISEALGYITDDSLKEFLFLHGYIDISFWNYSSPSSTGLSSKDDSFVYQALRRALSNSITVDDPEEVFNALKNHKDLFKNAYSPNLLIFMLEKEHFIEAEQILDRMTENDDWLFLASVIEQVKKNREKIIVSLIELLGQKDSNFLPKNLSNLNEETQIEILGTFFALCGKLKPEEFDYTEFISNMNKLINNVPIVNLFLAHFKFNHEFKEYVLENYTDFQINSLDNLEVDLFQQIDPSSLSYDGETILKNGLYHMSQSNFERIFDYPHTNQVASIVKTLEHVEVEKLDLVAFLDYLIDKLSENEYILEDYDEIFAFQNLNNGIHHINEDIEEFTYPIVNYPNLFEILIELDIREPNYKKNKEVLKNLEWKEYIFEEKQELILLFIDSYFVIFDEDLLKYIKDEISFEKAMNYLNKLYISFPEEFQDKVHIIV